jgi:serine/threonine protein kinase/CheY-like chemotaxis protein
MLASVATDMAMVDAAVPYDTPCTLDPERGGRYVLQTLIALGPRSWVYLADDRRLSTSAFAAKVVIKIARDSTAQASPEAELARQIEHPDVPAVLDRGVTELGHHYVVLEWVEGTSLSDVAVPWRGADVRRAVTFIARLGRILESAHAKGIVHCDLKPDNIRIGQGAQDGRPLLLDFDLAITQGHTPDGRTRGNLGYMAPEQLATGPETADSAERTVSPHTGSLTPQADIYALGGLLIYLLTGEPVNGADAASARANLLARRHWPGHADAEAGRVAVDDSTLLAIIRRAVDPDTTRRYRSMSQLVVDLDRWLADEPIDWQRPGAGRRARLWARRRPLRAAGTVAGALLIIGAIAGGFIWQQARARAETTRIAAEAERQQEMLRQVNQRATDEIERLKAAARQQIRQFLLPMLTKDPSGQGEQYLPVAFWLATVSQSGVTVYGENALGQEERLDALRRLAAHAEQGGQSETIGHLLIRVNVADLLIRTGRAGEARELIGQLRRQWQPRLAANDPLLPILDALDLTARLRLDPPVGPIDEAEIAAVRARLEAADAPRAYQRLIDESAKAQRGGR